MSPLHVYGWAYNEPIPFEIDQWKTNYLNSKEPNIVLWVEKRVATNLHTPTAYVSSQISVDVYDAADVISRPTAFHFHRPSEHTIDGKYLDAEFHINHFYDDRLDSPVWQTDVSIFFSELHYDRSISVEEESVLEDFFDNLNIAGQDDLFGLEAYLNF
mmetsp:Transcript_21898/g.34010  ORF Transcript_21898/g.34010 Transcript_21898/m.34010 type:complete len:158 (-) Transcript_21898:312-785(-)|eukprot:CAMPEP_0170490266 /NCGR_PEP_ID=MMETSP0208-20121228/8497_1 /TAXON_ID=197538 /ORGANISM="Strombidium inclinatum, Strain S3" /LENGTH=157 /DNA_ID=CAMNT_0010765575 /DNA_START=104 /DNA_END=577 /DNA_ORIENTATION=+